MQAPIVLINVFEVPSGMEEAFLAWWKNSSEALKQEPGFIDATLHQTLKAEARFQFINVAHWETPQALDQARIKNKDVLQSLPTGKGNPALYKIAAQY